MNDFEDERDARRSHGYVPAESRTIIDFYEGTATDRGGRKLEDIMAADARFLEHSHDYIQTLFPLPERSRARSKRIFSFGWE